MRPEELDGFVLVGQKAINLRNVVSVRLDAEWYASHDKRMPCVRIHFLACNPNEHTSSNIDLIGAEADAFRRFLVRHIPQLIDEKGPYAQ